MALSSKVLYSLFLALCLITINCYEEHTCNHDDHPKDIKFIDIEEETQPNEGRVLASSGFRIFAYYEYLNQTAPSALTAYVQNELIPPIIDYFQNALNVNYRVSGRLLLGSGVKSICERATPSILQSRGVPTDFFIYYDSEANSGTQIANSKYCFLAFGTKRPLVGRTLINRNMLHVPTNVLRHEQNMYTMMHEMMHILGFDRSLFKFYIDSNGKALTGHVKTINIAGATRTVLDLPPLTERLRNFYGCSSLPGAIMENGGGSSTARSHFERKYFNYETMTSGSILGRRISEFSLALLEGTGWYTPDYSYAEPFYFGQGQGCEFIGSKCNRTNPIFSEYCGAAGRGCAPHGRGGGSCSSDPIMEGCRFNYPSLDYDCENEDGADYARMPELQVYGRGAGSKCFEGTLNSRLSANGKTSFCFKYSCSGNGTETVLSVQVGNDKVTCSKEGTASIDGYYGVINCPDPLTFCNTIGKKYCPRNCMGRGTCMGDGTCQCEAGYSGVDCALNA